MAQARSDQERPPKLDAARRRLCIATRTVQSVAGMIRFVAAPDGVVVPDLERKLPGRGTWVTARRALVAQAAGRGAFARGLKVQVKTPADLPGTLEGLLQRSALDALSRAGKAGLVLPPPARAALAEGRVVALLRPRDAAADHSLEPLPWSGDGDRVEIVEAFTTAQLDLALGRLNVVNAALLTGRASETFLERWRILESFRADQPDEPRVRPHETALESGS